MTESRADRFNRLMARQKASVDARIANTTGERGLIVLLTGDGKGKTTSAFGTLFRALGYGMNCGVVQFIKGTQLSGEEILLRECFPDVRFWQMGTGFTWDTQNFEADKAAAEATWSHALELMNDPDCALVILDELTYMLSFGFLDEDKVIEALRARPAQQHVVITGRGGGGALRELADTVSEVKNRRHAYDAGIRAQQGLDF